MKNILAKIENEDVRIGEHCWALACSELLVVSKFDSNSYSVCGPWECDVSHVELELISIIPRPNGHKNTKLYYD